MLADVDGLLAEEIAISVIGGANLPAPAAITIVAAPIGGAGDGSSGQHARGDRRTPPAVVSITAAPIAPMPNATTRPTAAVPTAAPAAVPTTAVKTAAMKTAAAPAAGQRRRRRQNDGRHR